MTDGQSKAVRVAAAMSEVMNLAGMVRRGDDAAWESMGDDAAPRVATQLRSFADLVEDGQFKMSSMPPGVAFTDAAVHARALAKEVADKGIPVTEDAQQLATDLLSALGIGADILDALDGQ